MPTVLVTGANRGLGLEFCRQYAENGWKVIALCRTENDKDDLDALANIHDVEIEIVDVGDFAAVDALAKRREGEPIDLLINNAGVFGPKANADGDLRQSFGTMDYGIWENILRVNTMAPFKMVEALIENLRLGEQKKVVTLSSTVASIAEAESGIYAYRSAKTAVNMAMMSLAKQLGAEGILLTNFCPGWVNTRMGGAEATVTPEISVSGMRKMVDELTADNAGLFRRFNEDVIPW